MLCAGRGVRGRGSPQRLTELHTPTPQHLAREYTLYLLYFCHLPFAPPVGQLYVTCSRVAVSRLSSAGQSRSPSPASPASPGSPHAHDLLYRHQQQSASHYRYALVCLPQRREHGTVIKARVVYNICTH